MATCSMQAQPEPLEMLFRIPATSSSKHSAPSRSPPAASRAVKKRIARDISCENVRHLSGQPWLVLVAEDEGPVQSLQPAIDRGIHPTKPLFLGDEVLKHRRRQTVSLHLPERRTQVKPHVRVSVPVAFPFAPVCE